MRIIAGRYKGRTIETVRDLSVRPATDRVRETIYNILSHRMDLDGIRVLDLYAGSGSLGFEALSRGAAHVTFVEKSPSVIQHLRQNIHLLGCQQEAELVEMDGVAFVAKQDAQYELVFADPPYGDASTADLPGLIFSNTLVARQGYLVIEHSPEFTFSETPEYRIGPERQFGRTRVTFFRGFHNNPERTP